MKPSTFTATVEWKRGDATFTDKRYSRAHAWRFDGGAVVPGSSSPLSVPLPFSDEQAVDPEEAFVAALSSCHMLFFIAGAARDGYLLDSYEDAAVGTLEKNAQGRFAMSRVTLRPQLVFSGDRLPTDAQVAALHHWAHEECYLANSVKTEVVVEPR